MKKPIDRARERRLIVFDGLKHALDEGAKTHSLMGLADPTEAEQNVALAGIAEGLTRQVDKDGGPHPEQVAALARACVKWLEKHEEAA